MMETKNDVFEELLDAYDEETSSDGRLHQTDLLISYGDRFAEALDNEEQDSCPHCHDQEGKKLFCCYYLDRQDGEKVFARFCGDCGRDLREK